MLKKTRLAPGCKVIADALISVRQLCHRTGAIFCDQRMILPPLRQIVSACPPSILVFKRVDGTVLEHQETCQLICGQFSGGDNSCVFEFAKKRESWFAVCHP